MSFMQGERWEGGKIEVTREVVWMRDRWCLHGGEVEMLLLLTIECKGVGCKGEGVY